MGSCEPSSPNWLPDFLDVSIADQHDRVYVCDIFVDSFCNRCIALIMPLSPSSIPLVLRAVLIADDSMDILTISASDLGSFPGGDFDISRVACLTSTPAWILAIRRRDSCVYYN